jgi:hypothetical protein
VSQKAQARNSACVDPQVRDAALVPAGDHEAVRRHLLPAAARALDPSQRCISREARSQPIRVDVNSPNGLLGHPPPLASVKSALGSELRMVRQGSLASSADGWFVTGGHV